MRTIFSGLVNNSSAEESPAGPANKGFPFKGGSLIAVKGNTSSV